ncbi:MAG: alanine--tRNA ligase [Candidatus Yanofskybacteria bacterium]|nr:alanine--tRNA ligase [Candidatus Yanofskybacteria bacterium]
MTHLEIREKFLKFFEERGHKIVPSSSFLPNDPSVLFTTAGMQQFKPYYTGEADPIKDFGSLNAVSIQKSMRTSDIDEVGDESHLTFFEMLGNFSFGNYWKKEAIQYGYDFIIKELGVPIDRIKISVFKGDEQVPADLESLEIWRSLGITDEKIIFGERGDNFWGPTGNRGPCGPTTEIYIDGLEVWNIVFNEYFCDSDYAKASSDEGRKHFLPLAKRGIDTGMGLERLTMILQKKSSVFETDLFVPIIEEIRGKNLYDLEKNTYAERIIADHLRAAIFLIADGVLPSNVTQGYVLRRLLRRAIRYVTLLKLPNDIYQRVAHVIAHDIYDMTYPELTEKQKEILEVIEKEKNKFEKTLVGARKGFKQRGKKPLSGKEAFDFYQSWGLPIEQIKELAIELEVPAEQDFEKNFENARKEHLAISAHGAEKKFGGHGLILDTGELKAGNEEELARVTRLHTATHLLHASLRKILGEEVHQAGSDITAERLRFDFTFPRKMTTEEIKKVEELVNETITQNLPVTMQEMPYEEAIKKGALAFFKLKYPPIVKVYTVGPNDAPFSRELCGGPHVTNTGVIGNFKIVKEESISAGTRRIRAIVE